MDKKRNRIIAENIRFYIKQSGKTQKQVAEDIKISPSTLSDYLNLRSNPSHGVIQKLADYFEIRKSDIDTTYKEEDSSNILSIYYQLEPPRQKYVYDVAEQQLEEQKNVIEFPDRAKELIRGRRMAGGSALHVDDTDARKEVVSSALIPKGADELVEVVGKSMEPLIKDGEEVYIRYQPTVENGEIAVVRIENEGVTCKRVYVEENSIRLKAENPDYEDMYYDAGQVTILGKVLL